LTDNPEDESSCYPEIESENNSEDNPANSSKTEDIPFTESDEYQKNKREFIQNDYKTIKDEILQLKNGQIMIITAATSVTGVLLSFLINSYSQTTPANYFMDIIFFLPLLIILPSFAICIHKSTLINIKSGYVNRLGFYLSGYEKISKYFGYGNYSEEWYKRYENVSIDKNNELGINILLFSDESNLEKDETNQVIRGIKLLWSISIQFLKNSCSLLKFNQKYRYWSLIVTIFFGLIMVCYFFPFIHILQNTGNLSFLSKYLQFWFYLIIAFLTMAIYSLGKVLQLRNLFWFLSYFFQSTIFIFLFYSAINFDAIWIAGLYLIAIILAFIIGYVKNNYNIHIFKEKSNRDDEKDLESVKKWVCFFIILDFIISVTDLGFIKIEGTGIGFLALIYAISFIALSIFLWGFATIYHMSYGKAKVDIIEKIWKIIINKKNNDYPIKNEG
jgi:hypothetical protein